MNIQKNVSLKELNTFGIDKKATFYAEAHNSQEVIEAITQAEQLGVGIFILGGGSNILLTKDIDALVLKMNIKGIDTVAEDEQYVYLKVGAGEVWHDFVQYCIAHGYGGVENLSLIPGTVGASPMQNIGAYGVEIKDVFESLEAVHMQTKFLKTFSHAACRFGYRESIFKNEAKGKYIITHVTFRLSKQPTFNTEYGAIKATLDEMGIKKLDIQSISKAVIAIRQSKLPDPAVIGNAASFFKNPTISPIHYEALKQEHPSIPGFKTEKGIKVPAAWLLEQAGWKGKTFGNIGVHKDQPLVLVNYGGGEGEAIKQLSQDIQRDILRRYNIQLQPEVNVV